VERASDISASLLATRVGLNAEGLVRAMEKVGGATASPGQFWEGSTGKADPIARRASDDRAEQKRMGLDAGLPFDSESYAPIRSRIR
jgi:hypothetical protein